MKYYGITAVIIPYVGEDNTPERFRLQLNAGTDGIDRRKLLRGVRTFIKRCFGKKVSNDWIKKYLLIINEKDFIEVTGETEEQKRERLDRRYLAIQEEEDRYADQGRGYPEAEAATSSEAGMDMSIMQGEPDTLLSD